MTDKAIEIGRLGEKIALRFLRANGYRIVGQNRHQSHKEIDIIAKNKEYLAFVEVKTRSVGVDLYSEYGTPASAVTHAKQRHLIAAARSFLADNPTKLQIRMDVIEIYLDKNTKKVLKINHIENAYYSR